MKYNAMEICRIGIEVERNGREYYLQAHRQVTDENLKPVLLRLADEELAHERTYQRILEKLQADAQATEACCFDEEYGRYLEALAASRTFTDALPVATFLAGVATPAEILVRAMDFEKDAILWFTEIRKWVDADDQPVIDQFIAFEKEHLTILLNELEKLKGQ